jgi:hypothetical protein
MVLEKLGGLAHRGLGISERHECMQSRLTRAAMGIFGMNIQNSSDSIRKN